MEQLPISDLITKVRGQCLHFFLEQTYFEEKDLEQELANSSPWTKSGLLWLGKKIKYFLAHEDYMKFKYRYS